MGGVLLRWVALVLAIAFTLQGFSIASERFWGPLHYHAPALVPEHPASSHLYPPHADEAHSSGSAHDPGHHDRGQDHDADHAGQEPVGRPHAAGAGRSLNFGHDHDVEREHHASRDADRPAHPDVASPNHHHATGGGHRHERSRADVVYVDAGADQGASIATVSGFDTYWSVLPARILIELGRRKAARHVLAPLAYTTRWSGPPERPPRR